MAKLGVVSGLLIGLVLGSILGVMIGQTSLLKFPPSDHKAIAESFVLTDTETGYALTLEFLSSGKRVPMTVLPMAWTEGKSYVQSEWVWRVGKDSNAYMNIWGPLDDGVMYNVEISKAMGHPLRIVTPAGETVEDAPGYWSTTVMLG